MHREPLAELQARFLAAVEGREEANDLVRPAPGLEAGARLDIYRRMYWLRLREVMAVDFEAVLALAGDDAFDALVRGYLDRHPPRSVTLADLGAGFPGYLSATRPAPDPLIDLAHVEWALTRAAEAEASPALDRAALAGLEPEAWARLRLRPAAGLQLIAADHAVHLVLDAVRAGRVPPPPPPVPTFIVVWRRGLTVWRRPIPEPAFELLAALVAGAPLAVAIDAAAQVSAGDPEELERDVFTWFADWVAEGLFSAAEPT